MTISCFKLLLLCLCTILISLYLQTAFLPFLLLHTIFRFIWSWVKAAIVFAFCSISLENRIHFYNSREHFLTKKPQVFFFVYSLSPAFQSSISTAMISLPIILFFLHILLDIYTWMYTEPKMDKAEFIILFWKSVLSLCFLFFF